MNRTAKPSIAAKAQAIVAAMACMLIVAAMLAGCSNESKGEDSAEQGANSAAEANSESSSSDVVYEAIFLDNDEIGGLFAEMRGETPPFEQVTKDFHVTTEFKPETLHPEWYGESVVVHITSYAVQEIAMEDGTMTANEGFKAEVTSSNESLNSYLASLSKNYHITGAYKDGAKYTEYVDFSQGEPMDVTVTGTFGGGLTDGTIDLGEGQK